MPKYFERQNFDDILIEKVNLSRATVMEAGSMKERLLEDINLHHKKIIVDLSKCVFIDSTFLGAMVFSLKRTRETDGDIKLVLDTSSNPEELINLSFINKIFDIYTSVEDALQDYTTVIERTLS